MGLCSCSFLLIVSVCVTSGPSGPISNRFGKGGWRFSKHKEVQACAGTRPWQEAVLEGSPGELGAGSFTGASEVISPFCSCLTRGTSPFVCSVTPFEHDTRDCLSFDSQGAFPRRLGRADRKWKKVYVLPPETSSL